MGGGNALSMPYIDSVSHRITDASAIEARLLELAHTTEAKITAPALAYFAPCSLDDAGRLLDDLTVRDRLSMEIEDDGTVVYHMPGRQKLAGPAAPPASPPPPPALVRMAQPSHGPSPALAGLLSALIPGAGHLYAERPIAAILWFLVVGIGYTLLLPGLILHLFSIASATSSARRLEAARARPLLASFSAR
jgi:TM2 domain-containing membrane protein YozV